ncbi:hypothetical protein ZWY2020_045241 [Hordeum vulgare]|nr:hypothetical protein ZWY2020_045241 [Hordeum vulgare]
MKIHPPPFLAETKQQTSPAEARNLKPKLLGTKQGNLFPPRSKSVVRLLSARGSSATRAMAAWMRIVLLVVFLVHMFNVVAPVSARALKGDASWLKDGIGMVIDMLGDLKSGSSPPTHCC